ncbi:MAG: MATE family efflux transporter [Planctomycetota bacterium]
MSQPRGEVRRLLELAFPVVATQVGSMMLGLVDIYMVGQLGKEAIAAVSLGDLWVFGTLIIGIGVIMGMDPIVTQAHGAGRGERAGLALQRGIVLALLVSVPITGLWLLTEPILSLADQDAELLADAHRYNWMQSFSVAPFLVFSALRQYLQGRGIVSAPLIVVVIANGFNVLANWALIFGHLGLPALGIEGAGIATGLTRTFMMIALIVLIWRAKLHRDAWVPWSRASFSLRGVGELLRYGIAIAAHLVLEVWAFNLSTLYAGQLRPADLSLSAHVLTLKIASFSFMVPLAVGFAATTRVGNLLGARETELAQRAAWVALALGCGAMAAFAILFILLRYELPGIFTDDASVIALAATVLPIAAAFQLFDGTQAVGSGILRGMGQTTPALLINLLGFYGIALPLGWWLTFQKDWGLSGIWWGMCTGLGVVALLFLYRIAVRGPRTVTEFAV